MPLSEKIFSNELHQHNKFLFPLFKLLVVHFFLCFFVYWHLSVLYLSFFSFSSSFFSFVLPFSESLFIYLFLRYICMRQSVDLTYSVCVCKCVV